MENTSERELASGPNGTAIEGEKLQKGAHFHCLCVWAPVLPLDSLLDSRTLPSLVLFARSTLTASKLASQPAMQ